MRKLSSLGKRLQPASPASRSAVDTIPKPAPGRAPRHPIEHTGQCEVDSPFAARRDDDLVAPTVMPVSRSVLAIMASMAGLVPLPGRDNGVAASE